MDLNAYLVGGAVRDKLLGLPVIEKDYVVVGVSPADMLALGFKPVGKDFPVFLHPETKAEYALARTERKTAPGYRGFTVHASPEVTLEEDLFRRDLTINAMAITPEGDIVDPYGGLADIENRILRHVSAAFVEDPLRVLRLARFAARYKRLGFKVATETLLLAQAMQRAGELDALVPERVWQETWKALQEPDPEEYFQVLRQCGALAILFPEIEALFGVPSLIQDKHFMDSGVHALLALHNAARLSPLPDVRFAALTHGLGRALTPPDAWPEHEGYENYTNDAFKPLAERYKIARHIREFVKLIAKHHLQWNQPTTSETVLSFFEACDALRRPDRFANILLACEACFVSHEYPDHTEFLLKTLAELQECLKQVKPSMAQPGRPMKNIYEHAKADCLKKILREYAVRG